jgi:hypothetical protein
MQRCAGVCPGLSPLQSGLSVVGAAQGPGFAAATLAKQRCDAGAWKACCLLGEGMRCSVPMVNMSFQLCLPSYRVCPGFGEWFLLWVLSAKQLQSLASLAAGLHGPRCAWPS